ncbi:MAG: right-handed parallel beta-helix repeat-containing protein, partial [Acidimicrobiia bacterium]|nr:right-handed parallel beta-helix repeat-containing protein [Acidimicrobiia bacterium]
MPAAGAVTVKQRLYGFDLASASDTTVTGLNLFGTTIRTGDASQRDVLAALTVRYPSHFMDFVPDADPRVGYGRGCDSQEAGLTTTGIILRGTNNTVRDSTISDSAGNGVVMLGDHNTVTNNVIHDVDSSGGRPAGVFMFGHDQTISSNTIYSMGRGAIEATFLNNGTLAMPNNRISYNDLYGYGRLEQDFGGIYICCQIDFSGSSIDHNWVHDPQDMANSPASVDIGIYVDGGASNQLIASNVGWGNNHLTVGLVADGGTNNRVYNNDGGVWVSDFSPAPGTDIANNIGEVVVKNSDPTIAIPASNLQPPADPAYVDQAARDFRLTSGSPARGIGTVASGGTDGATDAPPDAGAYQYGAPYWQPGASSARSLVIQPQYGASTASGTPTRWWFQPDGA